LEGEGEVVVRWFTRGGAVRGEAKEQAQEAIGRARQEADRAVSDERVPRRYHHAIREYFDQVGGAESEPGG